MTVFKVMVTKMAWTLVSKVIPKVLTKMINRDRGQQVKNAAVKSPKLLKPRIFFRRQNGTYATYRTDGTFWVIIEPNGDEGAHEDAQDGHQAQGEKRL